ncbi:hypothetical protein GH714_026810 [Hevea brasiliensis]|uniref:SET domain-containing protein n=1 Tax=Hevea brasiliensis TaxID=3981 RepID=A0A6A6KUP3_HEVBR|nr:hypothetical protein GH714_026810 [Hevea brasiliensis]
MNAFRAMKAIGINEDKGENFTDEAEVHDEPERPLKRLRSRSQEGQSSQSMMGGTSLRKPKLDDEGKLGANSLQRSPDMMKLQPGPSDSQSTQVRHAYKGKEPLLPQVSPREKRPIVERPSHGVQFKDREVDPDSVLIPKQKVVDSYALIKPKDEPFTDDLPPDDVPRYEAPIAVIRPDSFSKEDISGRSFLTGKTDDQEPPASHFGTEEDRGDSVPASSSSRRANSELAPVLEESPANLEIASSSLGEVKISLSCNSLLGRPNFHMPSQDELLKSTQEKCLRSYKIFDPNFSVMQMLKDMCDCFLELATDSSRESQERLMNVIPSISALKRSAAYSALGVGGVKGMRTHCSANGSTESNGGRELRDPESCSLVVVPQHQLTFEELRSLHDFNDITKGEEVIEISWLNEINNECPPPFMYIPQNVVFQNAYLRFTLSQINAEDCCSTCIGDCLSSTTICVCACETGNEFAYTSEGLIREDFLEECISMTRDPQRQCLSYCKACPLERSKNDEILEPCKGHLKRKYIKECWSKCACHKRCGNRVVQRGIRCKLQVFFTPEGKGWGLRTLEKLPKGTFVCEYIGEILTNKELHERNVQRTRGTNNEWHTYPVLLDAYWFLKGALKEEEALCLDATFYGNVARFINHRCLDSNLIEIPVKVETPDQHYYHLAFFTAREVNALEELTWDYGLDFDDDDHPVEVFKCLCSSKFCRNMKRPNSKFILKLYGPYGGQFGIFTFFLKVIIEFELCMFCVCAINFFMTVEYLSIG